MMEFDSDYVIKMLNPFPLFQKHFGPSLIERGNNDNWFENRFIFDIYTDLSFVRRFDDLLNQASSGVDIDEVAIDLNGSDIEYDLRLFDTLSEIRFVIWAYQKCCKYY